MYSQSCKTFLVCAAVLALFGSLAVASHKKELNGTWRLVPTRSEFAGEPVIQTGTVTVNNREHNIYISRGFTLDGEKQSVSYSFTTDGRENSSIKEGKTFKSKAKWDDDVLKVTTEADGAVSVERYRLNPDGTMTVTVERPGHHLVTLFFERQ